MRRLLLGMTFSVGLALSSAAMAHHTNEPHPETVSRTADCTAVACPTNGGK